jgi:hypothetical protein
LAYFQVLRQQNSLGAAGSRPLSLNPTKFTPAKDARLIEILVDKEYEPVTNAIFESSPRSVLDIADGSPKVAVWTNVVAPLFNDFEHYRPEHRLNSENKTILNTCDPNSPDIPRRIADHLRSRFAALRSHFTVVYDHGWCASGQNDPERFPEYICLTSPLDVTMLWMFRALHGKGYDTFLHRCVRTVHRDIQVDSGNMDDALARIGGHGNKTISTSTKRSPLADLRNDLGRLLDHLKEDASKAEEERKIVLQSNRDRAASAMEEIEENIRREEPGSHKRKRFQKLYKRRKHEWVSLEKQVSEFMNVSFDEDDYNDDESFMAE